VVLNKLFGKSSKPAAPAAKAKETELTLEDLIALERYEEAAEMLRQRLKMVPKDLHAHLRLAEVYVSLKSAGKALDEYLFVADVLADDGFFDKGIAVLQKAHKLAPGDDQIPRRLERYKNMKALEKRRDLALEGLLANKSTGVQTAGNTQLQVQLLWNKIAKSPVVTRIEPETLRKLFSVMELTPIKAGQWLARTGQVLPTIFLIVDGTVEAEAQSGGRTFNIRNFTSGDLIGDSALLENKPWPADYKVTVNGNVFKLNREGLSVAMTGLADPREFLGILRVQANDRDVAANLQRLAR
jgi:tetratricopeptide (TPR) repeat protein